MASQLRVRESNGSPVASISGAPPHYSNRQSRRFWKGAVSPIKTTLSARDIVLDLFGRRRLASHSALIWAFFYTIKPPPPRPQPVYTGTNIAVLLLLISCPAVPSPSPPTSLLSCRVTMVSPSLPALACAPARCRADLQRASCSMRWFSDSQCVV